MNCENCSSSIKVIDGLCVRCRLLAANGIVPASRRYKKWPLRNLPLYNIIPLLCLVSLIFLIGSKYDFTSMLWTTRTRPGMLAPQDPLQSTADDRSWNFKNYLFRPLARYQLTARVLLKSNYWLSPGADISPIDLTLGWGPMSDQSVLDKIRLSSGYRYYYWSSGTLPIPADEINRHAANHHLIPKDDNIRRTLRRVGTGDLITLSGYLVEISKADGWHWTSSLSREDSGDGACEVFWVEKAIIK